MALSAEQVQQFKIDGYLLLPKELSPDCCQQLVELTRQDLQHRVPPFELETELHYPGAPKSKTAKGGTTIRRLLHAYERHKSFQEVARHASVTAGIQQLLKSSSLFLNPNHHNCVMTKQPEFSSETSWHRDTRYWNFSDKYLINAWYALGDEQPANGAMKLLPGSHRWDIQTAALDADQFLRLDHPYNQQRLATARAVTMEPGDVLLFSAHCFHAAGKNVTQNPKFSLVFTYHAETTRAIANTRSSALTPISINTSKS